MMFYIQKQIKKFIYIKKIKTVVRDNLRNAILKYLGLSTVDWNNQVAIFNK